MSTPEIVPSPEAEAFYANAYQRIVRLMIILPFVITPLLWVRFNRHVAFGFIAGCLIAVFNFYWLKRSVSFLADRVTSTGRKQSATGVVMGFLLRYFLIAAGAYGIFKSSAASVYGLFAGLFLPVGAILIEAVYETYGALRRGF
ncbi:MAG: hypothetical protein DMG65_08170 [Candidatus Angelobacter sp. Gp1-AA117]|nr:MAG: hypothetical protein DMG65_08170 [Candidatus Angelobacter sp. Gp1-AA117]